MPIDLTADTTALAAQLEDCAAIRSLPQIYCDCIWRRDADALAELFAEECALELGRNREALTSPTQIRDHIGASFAQGSSGPRPLIHNQVFELQGDRATGRSYLEVHMTESGQTRTAVGFYDEEFAREAGRWKFRSRRAQFVAPSPD